MEPQVSNQLTKAEPVVGLVASWLACRTLMLGAQPFRPMSSRLPGHGSKASRDQSCS